jgi:hypothetical protein
MPCVSPTSCYVAAIAHQGRGSSPWAAGTLPTCSYRTRTVTQHNGQEFVEDIGR